MEKTEALTSGRGHLWTPSEPRHFREEFQGVTETFFPGTKCPVLLMISRRCQPHFGHDLLFNMAPVPEALGGCASLCARPLGWAVWAACGSLSAAVNLHPCLSQRSSRGRTVFSQPRLTEAGSLSLRANSAPCSWLCWQF